MIAADECYSDLYLDESQPAPSLLRAAYERGNTRFRRCVVFHSLSKRSSLPGLRSGLVAGDPALIEAFLRYRTYHGSAMPVPTQLASIAAWSDEAHVAVNRRLYQQKFDQVLPILSDVLNVARPAGGFYLWPQVGDDDAAFVRTLYERTHLTILPGSYLAREQHGENPGSRPRAHLAGAADRAMHRCGPAAARFHTTRAERVACSSVWACVHLLQPAAQLVRTPSSGVLARVDAESPTWMLTPPSRFTTSKRIFVGAIIAGKDRCPPAKRRLLHQVFEGHAFGLVPGTDLHDAFAREHRKLTAHATDHQLGDLQHFASALRHTAIMQGNGAVLVLQYHAAHSRDRLPQQRLGRLHLPDQP